MISVILKAFKSKASLLRPPNSARRGFNSHFPSVVRRAFSHGPQVTSPSRLRRPWRFDDILAVLTWMLVASGGFVLIGTTTAASAALLLANSLQFQGKKKLKSELNGRVLTSISLIRCRLCQFKARRLLLETFSLAGHLFRSNLPQLASRQHHRQGCCSSVRLG